MKQKSHKIMLIGIKVVLDEGLGISSVTAADPVKAQSLLGGCCFLSYKLSFKLYPYQKEICMS